MDASWSDATLPAEDSGLILAEDGTSLRFHIIGHFKGDFPMRAITPPRGDDIRSLLLDAFALALLLSVMAAQLSLRQLA